MEGGSFQTPVHGSYFITYFDFVWMLGSIFNIQYRVAVEYGYHPAPVLHTILGYQASGTSRRQLFSLEYSHRSPGSYECTHLGLGRPSDTARAPDPRPEIIYTSPQSDFLSSGYEIITTCGGKSSKGLYERLHAHRYCHIVGLLMPRLSEDYRAFEILHS